MKAWTVDADDIHVADDFDSKVLHRTSWIEDFLSHSRNEKFIVTATKGFGKTLLLKAKRVAYQEGKNAHCLPENSLLDKPVGDKVFGADMIETFGRSTESWCKVWLISIAVATLKHLEMTDDLPVSPRLASILADRNLRSVIDHFVNVLDLQRSDLYRCANDTDNHLIPRLRGVSTPIVIFIDSIDEYFNKHMQVRSARASDTGELSPNVWYFSQMAVVEVAYQLRRINHHLKVFAAVRKEAFSRFHEATSMVQQYRGSTIDISYSRDGLREIFINNVRKEKERNLVDPSQLKKDPLAAFFGRSHVTHSYTHEQEDIFDYIYRHTLRRPRDFMTIGQRLSDLTLAERAQEPRLKQTVNDAATEIAQEYLNEIAPYLGRLDLERLFAMIDRNILERRAVEAMFLDYNCQLEAAGESDSDQHVFCLLYKAGLLGYVERDLVSRETVQRFLLPGERTFDPDGILPMSEHYLIHPVLAAIIRTYNPEYVKNIDRVNIVGEGRHWREAGSEQHLCVLRADVQGFGALMEDRDAEMAIRERLQQVTETYASQCVLADISDGDRLTIIHHDPNALIKIAKAIMVEVFEAPHGPQMRMAIDYGVVEVRPDRDRRLGFRGIPFLTAARLEPWVTPSQIWVTESFKQALETTPAFYQAVEIHPEECGELPSARGSFNLKKSGSSESDIWVRLYRIVERGAQS